MEMRHSNKQKSQVLYISSQYELDSKTMLNEAYNFPVLLGDYIAGASKTKTFYVLFTTVVVF